jgi:hypothetical protein
MVGMVALWLIGRRIRELHREAKGYESEVEKVGGRLFDFLLLARPAIIQRAHAAASLGAKSEFLL